MSLALLQNYSMISLANTMPFAATGGTPPYTFSVQGGGAGGTINASTGLYTSPASISTAPGTPNTDTVVVTDSLSATASGTIRCGYICSLICDVIRTVMGLDDSQVYVYNQKYLVPTDNRMYVAVGILSPNPFASTSVPVQDGSGLAVAQAINFASKLSIYMLSRDPSVLYQHPYLLMALSSPYALSQMELCAFRLGKLPNSMTNVPTPDGAAIPYVFNMVVTAHYSVSNTTTVPYYSPVSKPILAVNS